MRIEEEVKLDFDDVLIRPKRSTLGSRKEVDLEREYTFKHSDTTYKGVPIIAANMDTVGTFEMHDALDKFNVMTALHKHYSIEDLHRFYGNRPQNAWYSMGITKKDFEKLEQMPNRLLNAKICLDVANGYQESFVEAIKEVKRLRPHAIIMAGNVVTGDMTEELILAGADVVKVGIGPGSACTTRKETGVGYPQLSAIIECADAAHGLGGLVCADGGCKVAGDVVKAFGAGADFVMLGGLLAGHKEGGGTILPNGKVQFYGMSSESAMLKYNGEIATYRAAEGKTVELDYRGEVSTTIQHILGGLRSGMTYIGAKKLKEISKRTTFIKVNRQKNDVFGKE